MSQDKPSIRVYYSTVSQHFIFIGLGFSQLNGFSPLIELSYHKSSLAFHILMLNNVE